MKEIIIMIALVAYIVANIVAYISKKMKNFATKRTFGQNKTLFLLYKKGVFKYENEGFRKTKWIKITKTRPAQNRPYKYERYNKLYRVMNGNIYDQNALVGEKELLENTVIPEKGRQLVQQLGLSIARKKIGHTEAIYEFYPGSGWESIDSRDYTEMAWVAECK